MDQVISADSHVLEPPDLWTKALGEKWGDKAPHFADRFRGESGTFFFSGRDVLRLGSSRDIDQEERYQNLQAAGRDPALRLRIMDDEKIASEVLNASWAMLTPRILNGELRRACATVFNDFLVEYAGHDIQRLVGVALLPIDDVAWALAELERMAATGMKGVMVPVNPIDEAVPYRDTYYDPVWTSAVEKGLPVTLHSGTGKVPDPSTCFATDVQNVPGTFIEYFAEATPVLTNEFIFGGIFDRFPQLQLYLSEFDASWVPILRYRLKRIEKYPGLQPLKKSATQYLDDNVYVGFINDPLAAGFRNEIGVERMLWGSDFPHPPCPFPNIRERLDTEILVDVPDDDRRRLVADNVTTLYGIEL